MMKSNENVTSQMNNQNIIKLKTKAKNKFCK